MDAAWEKAVTRGDVLTARELAEGAVLVEIAKLLAEQEARLGKT